MKIFLGNNDIASVVTELKIVFKEQFNVDTLTYYDTYGAPSKVLSCKVDYNIYRLRNLVPYFRPRRISSRIRRHWENYLDSYFFNLAVKECDVFIFFWNTFKKDHSDLIKLKELGKKVFVVFVGDDVRWYYSQKQEFNSYGLRNLEYENYDYSAYGLNQKLHYLRLVERYADGVFSRLDQHQLGLRSYYRWNMMVDSRKYSELSEQRRECPVVVHAPTNRIIKGTDYVLEAFRRLEEEGILFKKVLIENMSHSSALEAYKNADIIIDQLICPGSGKLATESLAYGKVVLGHMAFGVYPQNEKLADYPIVDVNPETIYDVLKDLILNYEKRQAIAYTSRKFVENELDYKHFCAKVLQLANGEKVPFDYSPIFYRNKFSPESNEAKEVYNKWHRYVSDCSWYKENIEPGERDGLIF